MQQTAVSRRPRSSSMVVRNSDRTRVRGSPRAGWHVGTGERGRTVRRDRGEHVSETERDSGWSEQHAETGGWPPPAEGQRRYGPGTPPADPSAGPPQPAEADLGHTDGQAAGDDNAPGSGGRPTDQSGYAQPGQTAGGYGAPGPWGQPADQARATPSQARPPETTARQDPGASRPISPATPSQARPRAATARQDRGAGPTQPAARPGPGGSRPPARGGRSLSRPGTPSQTRPTSGAVRPTRPAGGRIRPRTGSRPSRGPRATPRTGAWAGRTLHRPRSSVRAAPGTGARLRPAAPALRPGLPSSRSR